MSERHRDRSSTISAFVIWLIITAVAALFVLSYSLALGDPKPTRVPIGVVGVSPAAVQKAGTINGVPAILPTAFSTVAAAERAVDDQRQYAVLAVDGGQGKLVVSSASGPSVARALEALAPTLARELGLRSMPVSDSHQMSARDPNGTVFFYMTLAAVILGFVGMVQTETIANRLRWAEEAGWGAIRSLSVGLVIVVTAGPILDMETPPFIPAWLTLSLTAWVAGATYATFRLLVGKRWAMLPTWVLFVLVGSPSSGGAVADPLLPTFFATVGPFMPAGACVELLREMTYFASSLRPGPIVALCAWGIASTLTWAWLHYRKYGWGRVKTE